MQFEIRATEHLTEAIKKKDANSSQSGESYELMTFFLSHPNFINAFIMIFSCHKR